ncbi:hypothetical protein NV379_23630 [Paenibacillus sp. N1-5-1-14]|uniref:hypothetical protein n=1 Tax=Paenibacillus radicibacter TaxID=2972488 RepID=UPI002158B340|nr:hypothetical protein [Paenibacillus radicibacter]MCR8645635.1 hypothetical protein [Paenibacillus radicibacter]
MKKLRITTAAIMITAALSLGGVADAATTMTKESAVAVTPVPSAAPGTITNGVTNGVRNMSNGVKNGAKNMSNTITNDVRGTTNDGRINSTYPMNEPNTVYPYQGGVNGTGTGYGTHGYGTNGIRPYSTTNPNTTKVNNVTTPATKSGGFSWGWLGLLGLLGLSGLGSRRKEHHR